MDSAPVMPCRSPHGERGLKSRSHSASCAASTSLPTRGAWIEILFYVPDSPHLLGRSPHGERGLKLYRLACHGVSFHVAPHTGSVD